jgi:hypothetical protein
MTSHRTISLTLSLLAVLMTVASSSAFANSLLGGYGGPGEGNQAILGSALLNVPRGGGGGSSDGTVESTGSSSPGSAGVGKQTVQKNAASTGSNGRGSTTPKGGRRPVGGASGGATGTYPASSVGETSRLAPEGSGALGLSGEDLLYVLLALGVLAFVGVLTRRLARTAGPEGA